MLQGFYVMKAAEVSESLKKRSLFSAKSTARLFGMLPESYRRFCGIFR